MTTNRYDRLFHSTPTFKYIPGSTPVPEVKSTKPKENEFFGLVHGTRNEGD